MSTDNAPKGSHQSLAIRSFFDNFGAWIPKASPTFTGKITYPTPTGAELSFAAAFKQTAEQVHVNAITKGWWDGERNEGELIALMHSELSEALEGLRHGNPASDHIPEFNAMEEELADVIIRIMDHAAGKGYRVGEALEAKIEFNRTRPHMHGGKAF